jgi:hypothetical protein
MTPSGLSVKSESERFELATNFAIAESRKSSHLDMG